MGTLFTACNYKREANEGYEGEEDDDEMGLASRRLSFRTIYRRNSMSQDYHQAGVFSFSQPYVAQQIRREKLRVQGFDSPSSLVGLDGDSGGMAVSYEATGMLSEMFNFPPAGGPAIATELLESQILSSFRRHPLPLQQPVADWFPHRQMLAGDDVVVAKNQTVESTNDASAASRHEISGMNSDPAAAVMQLFLMNPHHHQQSPSPASTPNGPTLSQPVSSTIHMLLPNTSGLAGSDFHSLGWVTKETPIEIPGAVESKGLSLSLSFSLQHLEAEKAEELRMEDNNMLFFCLGGGVGSTAQPQYQFKNSGGGHVGHTQGSSSPSSSYETVSLLRNSKYAKAAQELLEEFCTVGRGQFRKNKFRRENKDMKENPNSAGGAAIGDGGGNSSSSRKDMSPPLSAADRLEHQRRKVKLLLLLDEVDRRYSHYSQQMQAVVNSFDLVMGFGSSAPYTSLAQQAMSRHFRCLKDTVAAQVKLRCEAMGEKEARAASGVTKGETPRLRILEQSLRQQQRAAFQLMGVVEQEAWRPQRGLPEKSVNILRAWLFEHFLHPYPSDADKLLLARQTGLSRNQVSNWFVNARVRLWKPMVEEMYQQEAKHEDEPTLDDCDSNNNDNNEDAISSAAAQTPSVPTIASVTPTPYAAGKVDKAIDAGHEGGSFYSGVITQSLVFDGAGASAGGHSLPGSNADDIEATLIRFGAGGAGDVSLTLGLRHAGNFSENGGHLSVGDFGGR